jgi:hypothetical protein
MINPDIFFLSKILARQLFLNVHYAKILLRLLKWNLEAASFGKHVVNVGDSRQKGFKV